MSNTNHFDRRTFLKTSGAAVASVAAGGLVADGFAAGATSDVENSAGTRTTDSVSDSLSGPDDSDCWTWTCEYSSTCSVCIELSGPSDADFDLYVNEGGRCPTPSNYDYRSISYGSQETICLDGLDANTDLFILVDAYSGSGSYDLIITERT